MTWWSTASIRVRLTMWYSVVLFLMLIVYATATYVAVRHEFFEQLEDQRHEEREVGASSGAAGAAVLREAHAEEQLRGQLREILVVLVLGLPLVVVLAGAGGYLLARRALTPIDRLASEAQRITADRLHERVSVMNQHDEIGRLAGVINDTFARLEASFAQLRRFTADASHELRTPLSVIRGIGEVGLAETRTPAEYKEAIGSMLEEVDRLTNLVDTLLRLSRADAGNVRLSPERVDLGQLTRDVVSSLAVVAEERNQRLELDLAEDVTVTADRLVLREAITNVVDNAIKYSLPASTVEIRLGATADQAVLAVCDQGPGIAPDARDRIFDRFFRLDEGRSRDRGGTGLGLAIAKWAVEVNGGRIMVDSGENGGSVFRIVLPTSAAKLEHRQEHASRGMEARMKQTFAICALAVSLAPAAQAQDIPAEYQQVLTALGKQGDYKANVLKVNIPRNDVAVTVANVKTPTPFGFGGWIAMTKGTGGMDVMMGDLVLLQDEVNPVMSALLENGLEVTALHNHFFWDEPRMFYMHVHGHGKPADLARKVKPALDLIGKSTPRPPAPAAPAAPPSSTLDSAKLAQIVGTQGEQSGAVYKITIGRDDLKLTELGALINARMGLNTWAAFVGTNENAAIAGDVAMLAGEVTPVLKALRKNGLDVVAIHHHMTDTRPAVYFLHYWGTGPADKLATGFKAALNELGKAKTGTAAAR